MSRCQQGRIGENTLQSSSSKGKGKEISSTSPHPPTAATSTTTELYGSVLGGGGRQVLKDVLPGTQHHGCQGGQRNCTGGGHGEGRRAVCDPRDHCLSIRSGLEARGPLIFGGWGVSVMSDMKFACSIMQKWGLQSELFCLRNKEVATPCTSGPNHTRVTPVKRAASVPEAGSREHRGARVLFRTCRL